MLSKSKYTRGLKCTKSLWLYVYKKEKQKISESVQRVFNRGTSVGELARQYFPYGKMAVIEDYPGYESARRTAEFIEQGIETIYEATFIFNDVLVAIDILHKKEGKWNLYEVKSTKEVKPEHIKDAAIQYYVVNGCGLLMNDFFIMHFNRNYIRRGGLDINNLFISTSVKEHVIQLQNDIPNDLELFQNVLKNNEPCIEMGGQCTAPYKCDFYDYCFALLPKIKEPIVKLSSEPEVKQYQIKAFIDSIQYPICFLDFETIMPGVPMFDESGPYQQIPFQYSLHIQNEINGEIIHHYYIAESNINIDPRIGLIPKLIEETKSAKTIFVYNIVFERTRIDEMIKNFPNYARELANIRERLVDLIIPFRKKFYRTETMMGSSSIKKVLPALCPEFSYDELEIGNGMTASNAFLDLYYCDDENTIASTREKLLKYCHLDTLAMVKIFEVLQKYR